MTAKEQGRVKKGAPAPALSQKPLSMKGNAVRQRRRRNDPSKRRLDYLVARLRDEVCEQLVKNHSEEFKRLFDEKRLAHGLEPYHPGPGGIAKIHARRRREALEAIPIKDVPPDPVVQVNCKHDEGLKKLPYGVFCAKPECGKRIR